jgi:hypothetical protein
MKMTMKMTLATVLVAMTTLVSTAQAEYYNIDIKRVDTKLAIVNGNIPIEWQLSCLEVWAGTESAILKYDGKYSWDNFVLFDNGRKCELKSGQ